MSRFKMKVSSKKHPDMTQSKAFTAKLRTDEDMYAEGGKIADKQRLSEEAEELMSRPQEDEHSETGKEKDDTRVHPEEDDFFDDPDDYRMLAKGGEVSDFTEEEIDHGASIAAAIMAKRRKMAEGGEILSEDALETTDDEMADLSRNAEEDQNFEDQLSFDALRKENYAEADALDQLDQPEDSNLKGQDADDEHDMDLVSAIRSKMKKRSAT